MITLKVHEACCFCAARTELAKPGDRGVAECRGNDGLNWPHCDGGRIPADVATPARLPRLQCGTAEPVKPCETLRV